MKGYLHNTYRESVGFIILFFEMCGKFFIFVTTFLWFEGDLRGNPVVELRV
jgi:hypothetical protein